MKKGATLKSEIQRIQGRSKPPGQYQQGWAEFYKLKFFLTPDVLIPRPETELLVDEVIQLQKDCFVAKAPRNDVIASEAKQSLTILDIGTGSGCIAISIAKNLPQSKIIATDISIKALEVAQKNAKYHKVLNKIFFLESDLLDFIGVKYPRYSGEHSDSRIDSGQARMTIDIIVANLPYIPTARLMYIDPMVTEFEPRVALDGGQDGFELYRNLFAQIASYLQGVKLNHPEGGKLNPEGGKLKYLFGEIDYTHTEIAMSEAKKFFPGSKTEIKKDLAKKDRILIVKF